MSIDARVTMFAAFAFLIADVGRALAAPAPQQPFTFEAARAIAAVSSPAISPDGTRVVYIRSRGDYKADKAMQELVLVDLKSGRSRPLTRDREGIDSPAWSPDGTRLAFLASPQSGKPAQVFVMPMDGGDAQRITDAKSGVFAFSWRPGGAQLVYAARDEAPNAKDIEKHLDAFVAGDNDFLARAATLPSHLWLVSSDGNDAKQVTTGATSVYGEGDPVLRWSPDGGTLLYARQPDGYFARLTRVQVVARDMTSGDEKPVGGMPVTTFASYSNDGTKLAYIAPRHGSVYLENDAYVIRASDGAKVTDTLGIDRNAAWARFMPDGSLAYAAPDGVRNALWFLPPNGAARRVDLGDVDFTASASIANDGSIAFVGRRPDHPPEIFILPAGATAPRATTDDNAFIANYALGKPTRIDWTTDDGLHACGVLTYPPNFEQGKTYPLVLVIHGGPVSTSTQDFSVLTQVLAAHGFLVFNPNYRGSDDLGDAYLQAIVGHPTSGPGRDNLAGLAAVEKLGIVDTTRIGVSGWSGGGLQTSWLIGHSHVWKAAVTGAGVHDWYEQAVLADINEEFADVFMGGATPWTADGRALFASESPITYVGDITTPTLILSDTKDQRVPITQSYALFHALEDRKVPVKFVAFPRAGHFPSDPVGVESVYRTWSDWFVTELK
jgi:dipeptidyl aminopeptidase/acylaminoacyl peptidase